MLWPTLADLPDMDIPINNFEEARVILSWEDMNEHMRVSALTKHTRIPSSDNPIKNSFSSYSPIAEDRVVPPNKECDDREVPYWNLVRRACHPDSAARRSTAETSEQLRHIPDWDGVPDDDYVQNFTSSTMPCNNPHLRNLHGNLIHPEHSSTTSKLLPVFSASKISGIHNDIILPSAVYFDSAIEFAGRDAAALRLPWDSKRSVAFWRDRPTGDREASSWRRAQRQRLVSMTNATLIESEQHLRTALAMAETQKDRLHIINKIAGNSPLPRPSYHLAATQTRPSSLATWVGKIANTSLTDVTEPHLLPWFEPAHSVSAQRLFEHKYLPDLDGYAASGHYRSLLLSSSVPLKSTIHREWHDARPVPWAHFVPLDNTLRNWWGVMEYFVGFNSTDVLGYEDAALNRAGHDEEARRIALQGQEWAEKALTHEDMTLYIFRLLLEYARVCDERRLDMGWTGDLGEAANAS